MNFSRYFGLPRDLTPQVRANTKHYYLDISWWGLYAGATMAFLTIYAARIGATPAQIGLLSALPAALALLFSLPFAGLVRRMGAHRATWVGAAVARLMLLSFALLPFFFPDTAQQPNQPAQVWAILILSSLMALPNTLTGIGFPQLMIEALPGEWRGFVVGARNAFFSIISFVVTVISGQILVRMAFPGGYQVVFFIGFVGALMTAYHLYRVRPLQASPPVAAPPAPAQGAASPPGAATVAPRALRLSGLPDLWGRVQAGARSESRYVRVLLLLFFFNVTNHMVVPLIPEVLVNQLRLSDALISIGTAGSSLIVFLVSLGIARLTGRTGNRRATAIGAVLIAAQALILAVASSPAHYLFSVLVGGVGQGILISAQFNYHLENVPETDRSRWLSWALLVGNAALLIGALGGPLLAGWLGVPLALAAFGILRLVMAGALVRFG